MQFLIVEKNKAGLKYKRVLGSNVTVYGNVNSLNMHLSPSFPQQPLLYSRQRTAEKTVYL